MNISINLHTHTYRCRHGSGNVSDFCREACACGMTVLGFSEHVPFPDGRYGETRMPYDDLPAYRAEIEAAKPDFPDLRILAGLELEYEPDFIGEAYPALKERLNLDYFIGGLHFIYDDDAAHTRHWFHPDMTPHELDLFVRSNIRFMESGLIACLAHPDMSLVGTSEWNADLEAGYRDLIQASIDLDVPLEINANGLRKGPAAHYPWPPVWRLAAELGAKCVAGMDAHRPANLQDHADELLALVSETGVRLVNDEVAERIAASTK